MTNVGFMIFGGVLTRLGCGDRKDFGSSDFSMIGLWSVFCDTPFVKSFDQTDGVSRSPNVRNKNAIPKFYDHCPRNAKEKRCGWDINVVRLATGWHGSGSNPGWLVNRSQNHSNNTLQAARWPHDHHKPAHHHRASSHIKRQHHAHQPPTHAQGHNTTPSPRTSQHRSPCPTQRKLVVTGLGRKPCKCLRNAHIRASRCKQNASRLTRS